MWVSQKQFVAVPCAGISFCVMYIVTVLCGSIPFCLLVIVTVLCRSILFSLMYIVTVFYGYISISICILFNVHCYCCLTYCRCKYIIVYMYIVTVVSASLPVCLTCIVTVLCPSTCTCISFWRLTTCKGRAVWHWWSLLVQDFTSFIQSNFSFVCL